VLASDVNGDGKVDILISDGTSGTIAVLLGNGDGTLQKEKTYPIGSSAAAAGRRYQTAMAAPISQRLISARGTVERCCRATPTASFGEHAGLRDWAEAAVHWPWWTSMAMAGLDFRGRELSRGPPWSILPRDLPALSRPYSKDVSGERLAGRTTAGTARTRCGRFLRATIGGFGSG